MHAEMKRQRVLVTAGARGIGLVIAQAFVRAGAQVHICDVVQERLDEVQGKIPSATLSLCDVSNASQVEHLFADVEEHLGGLDVLVNNAGIAGPTAPIQDITIEDWERCIAVDLSGTFYCARRAVPMLQAAGGGSITNISSVAGRLGYPLRTPYAAAKWGVVGLTKSLAIELGSSGIRVNAVLPGFVKGERSSEAIEAKAKVRGVSFEEQEEAILEKVALHTMVTATDIASMVLYLASDAGNRITGQAMSVCGGLEMLV